MKRPENPSQAPDREELERQVESLQASRPGYSRASAIPAMTFNRSSSRIVVVILSVAAIAASSAAGIDAG
jgi:hypothetical protein